MAELNAWDVTDANNNAAPPDGWPENTMQYSEVNNTGRAVQGTLKRFFADINGSLQFGGLVNAYTLTLNAGYTSYFQGMYFAAEVNITNTGAVTLNVNGLGVQTVVNVGGGALGAGDLQAGGIYEFRYDGTNFQLMGDIAGGSITADELIQINADINTATPPTTEAVTALLRYYDADGTDELGFLGYSGNNVLQLENRMHGGPVFIQGEQADGTPVNLIVSDPDGATSIYADGNLHLGATTQGAAVRSAGNLDTETRIVDFLHQDGTRRGYVGYGGGSTLLLYNQIHGAPVSILAENAVGTQTTLFTADPDTAASMYYAGVETLATTATGINVSGTLSTYLGPIQVGGEIATSGLGLGVEYGGRVSSPTGLDNRVQGFIGQWNTGGPTWGGTAGSLIICPRTSLAASLYLAAGSPSPVLAFSSSAGTTSLYYNGDVTLATAAAGIRVADTSGNDPIIEFYDAGIINRAGYIWASDTAGFQIASEHHGMPIYLVAEDAGGTLRTILEGDPDTTTTLMGDTDIILRAKANNQTVLYGKQDGATDLYYNNVKKFETSNLGITVRGSLNNDPTTGGVQDVEVNMANLGGTEVGDINYLGSANINIRNLVHGGHVILTGQDTATGSTRTFFVGDPDATTTMSADTSLIFQVANGETAAIFNDNDSCDLYYDNVKRFETATTGQARIFRDDNLDVSLLMLRLANADGTNQMLLGYTGNETLFLRNEKIGANIEIQATDALDVTRSVLTGDPDGSATLYYDGLNRIATAGSGGVAVRSDDDLDLSPRYVAFTYANGTVRGYVGHESAADTTLYLDNQIEGGWVSLEGQATGGGGQTILRGDPDDQVALYFNGNERAMTAANGFTIETDVNTDTVNNLVRFTWNNGTLRGYVGQDPSGNQITYNAVHGGKILMQAEDAGGTPRAILDADPDSTTILRADTNIELQTNAGDPALIGVANDRVELYFNSVKKFETKGSGVIVSGQLDAGNSAAMARFYGGSADHGYLEFYVDAAAQSTRSAYVGYASIGSEDFRFQNEYLGGSVQIAGTNAGSTVVNFLDADPDAATLLRAATNLTLNVNTSEPAFFAAANGAVTLYYNNIERLSTGASGQVDIRGDASPGIGSSQSHTFQFKQADGLVTGFMGYNGSANFDIAATNDGGKVVITAQDVGNITRTILDADPDASTILRGDTDVVLQCNVSNTALAGRAGAEVELYYNNQEQFRTSNEAGADIGMGAEVRHNDDSFYPVGMNTVPEVSAIDTGNETLALDICGKMIHYNSGTARSLFFNNDGNIPVGAMWSLIVGPSAGTLTGDGGTGVQIRYWNGTDWTTTAAAGNITIGKGQYTIWKETDTLYHISGPNLS